MGRTVVSPYQVFFPVGWLFSIAGTFIWIAFRLQWIAFYPGVLHPDLMIGGFLLQYAFGFLMTAVPKFTGTESIQAREWAVMIAMAFLQVCTALVGREDLFHFFVLGSFLGLISFVVPRFRMRSFNPPSSFVFIGLGVVVGVLGVLLVILSESSLGLESLRSMGRGLYLRGVMTCLVLGVGSKMIPALLGYSDLPTHLSPVKGRSLISLSMFLSDIPVVLRILFGLMAASFIVEGLGLMRAALFVQAIAVFGVGFIYWKMHRMPQDRRWFNIGLWTSCICFCLGFLLAAVFFDHWIDCMHVTYIGGMGLMTLLISTRVTLAHGGYSVREGEARKVVPILILMIVLVVLTRVSISVFPSLAMNHLAYAAGIWILGMAIWGAFYFQYFFPLRIK